MQTPVATYIKIDPFQILTPSFFLLCRPTMMTRRIRQKTALLAILATNITIRSCDGFMINHHHRGGVVVPSRMMSGSLSRSPSIFGTQLAVTSTPHSDEERMLLTEPALAAYVEAEVEAWLLENSKSSGDTTEAATSAARDISMALKTSYERASSQNILSNFGALTTFLTNELCDLIPSSSWKEYDTLLFRSTTTTTTAPTPYSVAKHCVDVLHYRLYRGTYTKTITPHGAGDIAAREVVGLPPIMISKENEEEDGTTTSTTNKEQEEDNCLVEPPAELINADCLWTERDQAQWRNTRFEKITMEGFRDPRRGNSGTSR